MSGLITRKRCRSSAGKPFRERIPSSKLHTEKSGPKFVKKLFFWHCLALSGTDKQQHLDGKFDGEFSFENRLSFEKQLDKKLVHNRVGVNGIPKYLIYNNKKLLVDDASNIINELLSGNIWQLLAYL